MPSRLPPELVISEVFSHGTAGGAHGADFVEVHNAGTPNADLTQVTLRWTGPHGPAHAARSRPAAARSSTSTWPTSQRQHLAGLGARQLRSSTWSAGAPAPTRATRGSSAGSATESAQRDEDDTDTDQNGDDFRAATPSRGSAYVPPPTPLSTIAEIQGTGPASPWSKSGSRPGAS